jgi:hypothetical protein
VSAGCDLCAGDGWYVDHEDECYEDGDCNCSGVQRQCERCAGTGRLDHDHAAVVSRTETSE